MGETVINCREWAISAHRDERQEYWARATERYKHNLFLFNSFCVEQESLIGQISKYNELVFLEDLWRFPPLTLSQRSSEDLFVCIMVNSLKLDSSLCWYFSPRSALRFSRHQTQTREEGEWREKLSGLPVSLSSLDSHNSFGSNHSVTDVAPSHSESLNHNVTQLS